MGGSTGSYVWKAMTGKLFYWEYSVWVNYACFLYIYPDSGTAQRASWRTEHLSLLLALEASFPVFQVKFNTKKRSIPKKKKSHIHLFIYFLFSTKILLRSQSSFFFLSIFLWSLAGIKFLRIWFKKTISLTSRLTNSMHWISDSHKNEQIVHLCTIHKKLLEGSEQWPYP